MILDPMNTTERDGAPCSLCGDDAVWSPLVNGHEINLCGDCTDDQTTVCPSCHTRIYQQDGIRLYSTTSLYCASCAHQHPALIEGREAASCADVDRDDALRRG
jgi:hypothetical protein